MAQNPLGQRVARLGLLLGGALAPWAGPVAAGTAPVPLVQVASAVAAMAPAAAPMLAKNWQSELDPAVFLVSEKLDGVRALWDGHVLRFKSGRVISAPLWFTAALPATPLDGELWMGRRSFDSLSGAVRRSTPVDSEWREVRYMVFDIPGGDARFAQRVARIPTVVAESQVPWLQTLEQFRLTDRAALRAQLQKVVAQGGEGLVLHRADAQWQTGRSDALRKLKAAPDEDARVVAVLAGKGRHAGRMGALVLEMPSGKRFSLGTGFTDAQRESPPAVGELVTYRYRDHTPAGLPKFASYLRTRDAE